MAQSPIVNSLEAMLSTIRIDPLVHGWFTFYLRQPQARARVCAFRDLVERVAQLEKSSRALTAAQGVLAFSILAPAILDIYVLWLVTLVIWWITAQMTSRHSGHVAVIMRELLTADFPADELGRTTLYQVSERYAVREGIPSLVEAICCHDLIARWLMAACLVVLFLVYPWEVNFWQGNLIPLSFYFAVILSLRMPWFYSFLSRRGGCPVPNPGSSGEVG